MSYFWEQEVTVRNRTEARYKLAELLTRRSFKEASGLADTWIKEGLINSEDHDFVQSIIGAATRMVPDGPPSD